MDSDPTDISRALRVRGHLKLVYSNEASKAKRMDKLKRADLLSLETYATERSAFRSKVIAHKKQRKIALGEHVTLLFEDRLTVQYQIQEMLRIERIFEPAAIQEELDAYNPLIPDGSNLKATMLIEFSDPEVRKIELARLGGIEHRVFVEVDGHAPALAIADEDLDRSEGDKTAAVHFLRFELSPSAILALRGGASLSIGIDDPRMPIRQRADDICCRALAADLS